MDKFQEKIRKESEANKYKIGVFQGKNANSYYYIKNYIQSYKF